MAAVSGTAETGPPMETVVLVEPVAVQRLSAAVLLSAVRRENRLVGAYLEETATVAATRRPAPRASRLVVVRAEQSSLSPRQAVRDLVKSA